MSPPGPLRLALLALVCGCIFTSRPQLPDTANAPPVDASPGVTSPSDAASPPARGDGGADFVDAAFDATAHDGAASDTGRCPMDDVRDAGDDVRDAGDDVRDAGDADDVWDPCHPPPDAAGPGAAAR